MRALKPCIKFVPDPDRPTQCFWCHWDEVPHLVPEDVEFELTYWDTLYGSTDQD